MAVTEAHAEAGVGLGVRKLSPALGAEVTGVDLAEPLDDATLSQIREIWAEHPVLVFPGQHLSEAQQVAFSRRFGELAIFIDKEKRSSGQPEILRIANVDEDGNLLDPDHPLRRYFAILTGLWHTDGSYKAIPSFGSMLHGLEVPPEGGETCYANMFRAYEAMPAEMKARIDGLHMVHNHEVTRLLAPGLEPMSEEKKAELPPVTHPLVRRHDDGRKSLYISANVAYYVGGMDLEAGKALHRELMEWAGRPEFVYCHKWRQGDLLMWDNRGLLHRVTPYDARKHRRVMQRTEIMGTEPVR